MLQNQGRHGALFYVRKRPGVINLSTPARRAGCAVLLARRCCLKQTHRSTGRPCLQCCSSCRCRCLPFRWRRYSRSRRSWRYRTVIRLRLRRYLISGQTHPTDQRTCSDPRDRLYPYLPVNLVLLVRPPWLRTYRRRPTPTLACSCLPPENKSDRALACLPRRGCTWEQQACPTGVRALPQEARPGGRCSECCGVAS